MVIQMNPKLKIFGLLSSFIVAFALTGTAVKAEEGQIVVYAKNETMKQIIPNNPIVIQTVLENYDQPTLKEYEECHQNAEKCRNVCAGVADAAKCVKECPICPELIKEQQVVQGVNDTQLMPSKQLNTTTIIRLTNQIHNIIDNSRGNITLHNDNVVHLHQNVSTVGGKFGLGYNNTDQCCIILRRKKDCDMVKFSTASRCHRKRHRVCGKQCKSRVMVAKRVTVCDQQQPDPLDYFESENCQQIVKYVPYRNSRSPKRTANRCAYTHNWPFVTCPQQRQQMNPNCADCLRLTYGYILRNGIPMQCSSCFSAYGRSSFNDGYMYPSYPQFGWYPPMPMGVPAVDPPIIDNNDDFDLTDDWREDKTKCILPDGNVSNNCEPDDGSGGDKPVTDGPEFDYYDDDYQNEEPFLRTRRQTFSRSKYSRRYRHAIQ